MTTDLASDGLYKLACHRADGKDRIDRNIRKLARDLKIPAAVRRRALRLSSKFEEPEKVKEPAF